VVSTAIRARPETGLSSAFFETVDRTDEERDLRQPLVPAEFEEE